MKMEQSVPKCWHIKFGHWGIKRKNATFTTWRKFEIKKVTIINQISLLTSKYVMLISVFLKH